MVSTTSYSHDNWETCLLHVYMQHIQGLRVVPHLIPTNELSQVCPATSAKRNSSYSTYSILFLTYTSYFGGKKGISRNKMKKIILMNLLP